MRHLRRGGSPGAGDLVGGPARHAHVREVVAAIQALGHVCVGSPDHIHQRGKLTLRRRSTSPTQHSTSSQTLVDGVSAAAACAPSSTATCAGWTSKVQGGGRGASGTSEHRRRAGTSIPCGAPPRENCRTYSRVALCDAPVHRRRRSPRMALLTASGFGVLRSLPATRRTCAYAGALRCRCSGSAGTWRSGDRD